MMEKEMLSNIYSKLWTLVVRANCTSFFHTSYAILLSISQPDYLLFTTRWLYPDIAKQYQTTATAVEKNIRTVLDLVWNQHSDALEHIAQHRLKEKPTVSQFISILVYSITSGRAA